MFKCGRSHNKTFSPFTEISCMTPCTTTCDMMLIALTIIAAHNHHHKPLPTVPGSPPSPCLTRHMTQIPTFHQMGTSGRGSGTIEGTAQGRRYGQPRGKALVREKMRPHCLYSANAPSPTTGLHHCKIRWLLVGVSG